MLNLNDFTPEQVYNLENSLLEVVGSKLETVRAYEEKIRKEILKIKANAAVLDGIENLLKTLGSESEDSAIDVRLIKKDDYENSKNINDLLKNSIDASSFRDTQKDSETKSKLLETVEEFHNQMLETNVDVDINILIYDKYYSEFFSMFDYKALNIKELSFEPLIEIKREAYNKLKSKRLSNDHLNNLYEDFKNVVENF